MKPILCALLSAACLAAQTAPALNIGLDINAETDVVVAQGWPLLIRVAVNSADGSPVNLAMANGDWTQALRITITDQSGKVQNWPMQLMPAAASTLSLSGFSNAEAVWLVSPDATAGFGAGTYDVTVTLDTTKGAAAGSWTGTVAGNASVQLQPESPSMSAEDVASKYLAISAYAQFQGDLDGAGAALDTLISLQPDVLAAYSRKAEVLAAGGDYADALGLYQQTLDMFQAKNPDAQESLVMFTAPIVDTAAQLVAQQNDAAGVVRNAIPGGFAPVFAAESIVSAYGSRFSSTTVSATDFSAISLGGATVTITDSSGATLAAPLLSVSPGEVRYVAPASLALGPAKVIMKTADGRVRTGAVTIVDVHPGLISGRVVRKSGKPMLELDATGIRHAATGQVQVTVGGVSLPVTYAGADLTSAGIDHVEAELPATLAARGDVPVVLRVAGRQSNRARVAIR
jgi:hypothetical protein